MSPKTIKRSNKKEARESETEEIRYWNGRNLNFLDSSATPWLGLQTSFFINTFSTRPSYLVNKFCFNMLTKSMRVNVPAYIIQLFSQLFYHMSGKFNETKKHPIRHFCSSACLQWLLYHKYSTREASCSDWVMNKTLLTSSEGFQNQAHTILCLWSCASIKTTDRAITKQAVCNQGTITAQSLYTAADRRK